MKTVIALILFIFAVPSQADWKEKAVDVLLFASGMVVSFAVHEASHELVARSYGEKLDWNDANEWSCRLPCKHHDKVAIAGNLSTAILGESLLYLPSKYRYMPFVDGMQTYNTSNPISYLYLNSRSKDGYGDYMYLDKNMDNVITSLAIHAASIGYRQFSERTWRFFVIKNGIVASVRF